jgi:hypothetical protein
MESEEPVKVSGLGVRRHVCAGIVKADLEFVNAALE